VSTTKPSADSATAAATPAPLGVATTLAVVVPTRNEADNIRPLVTRLRAALADAPDVTGVVEVVFVDDSDDDTPAVVDGLSVETYREIADKQAAGGADVEGLVVRLLHRTASQRTGGLGGAVVAGIDAVQAPFVVVMDGDLQHPPETVPELVRALVDGPLDLVVASRYTGGGDAGGLDGRVRGAVSSGATLAAKAVFPRALRGVTDPMTGFFGLRRSAVPTADLHPRGFKILLEILARTPGLRVGEVPFVFQPRHAGESKASLREGMRFATQLLALRTSVRRDRAASSSATPTPAPGTHEGAWVSGVREVHKPWGHETIFALVPGKFCGKVLHVSEGQSLSLQYHEQKEEVIFVETGRILLEVGVHEDSLERVEMSPGDAVHLTPGIRHRVTALTSDVRLLEASTTELHDVVRLEDRYGRAGTSEP